MKVGIYLVLEFKGNISGCFSIQCLFFSLNLNDSLVKAHPKFDLLILDVHEEGISDPDLTNEQFSSGKC